ncbi:type II secretion system F family protein [Pseudomonas sp. P7]|jgi:tight adherence protein C|uniref:type II secretion system F family protein n=1 Tax=Pseudomonas TaxID=286 RepID=UPI00044E94DE|nr:MULTISPECIES: type II secretion system F family protein [Pseudomonas]EZP66061.1 membrane protein [Pseudomonas sp. RIT357]MBA2926573.1 type II secretion system F family protein [Pseudomonas sivasensis]MBA2932184.1 type II secretion system F family protein [Pseudomonas sivasensis]OYU06274.1 MAG: type II secretion system protein F [Pseudomonas sp. PGPPP1]
MAMLISAVLFFAATLLLVGNVLAHRRQQRVVTSRLQGETEREDKIGRWLRTLGNTRIGQRTISLDNETQTLLNRIGWRKAGQRSMFAACQVGAPLVLLGLTLLIQSVFFPDADPVWLAPFLGLATGYLLPKRVLASLAKRRQEQITQEISTFIPLLRILFESGMAVEQTLRVMSQEAQKLLPVLTSELRIVLARVDSGLELGEELNKTSLMLSVDEFSDTCTILQQLLHQGGGAMKSLQALKQLLDDRRLTRMQEYISKMSAKMSVVMMVFLFPALLIVLAGPGFIAISKAMGP